MMRRGFTLVELLVVVAIIGIVYTLVMQNLSRIGPKATFSQKQWNIKELKEHLKSFSFEKELRLVCLDGCQNCLLVRDGKILMYPSLKFPSHDVTLYRYFASEGFVEVDPEPYFNTEGVQEDVCFSYRFFGFGRGEQLIVQSGVKVFDLGEMGENVGEYESLEALKEHKEELLAKVLQ